MFSHSWSSHNNSKDRNNTSLLYSQSGMLYISYHSSSAKTKSQQNGNPGFISPPITISKLSSRLLSYRIHCCPIFCCQHLPGFCSHHQSLWSACGLESSTPVWSRGVPRWCQSLWWGLIQQPTFISNDFAFNSLLQSYPGLYHNSDLLYFWNILLIFACLSTASLLSKLFYSQPYQSLQSLNDIIYSKSISSFLDSLPFLFNLYPRSRSISSITVSSSASLSTNHTNLAKSHPRASYVLVTHFSAKNHLVGGLMPQEIHGFYLSWILKTFWTTF